jgi:nicotinate-nucleotide pyrophosphorylase (carboxylating)
MKRAANLPSRIRSGGLAGWVRTFHLVSEKITVESACRDGDAIAKSGIFETSLGRVAAAFGRTRALNFPALSGIATLTRQFVEAVSGTGTTILDISARPRPA